MRARDWIREKVRFFSEGDGPLGGQILLILYRLVVIMGFLGGAYTIWSQFRLERMIDERVSVAFALEHSLESTVDRYRQASVAALLGPYIRCPPRGVEGSQADENARQELLDNLFLRGASDYRDLEQGARVHCSDGSRADLQPKVTQPDERASDTGFFRALEEAEVRYRLGLQNDATATQFANAYSTLPPAYAQFVDNDAASKARVALTERRVGEAIDNYVVAFRRLANGPDNVPPVPFRSGRPN